MKVELRQLRYFVAVARERNFTRAAQSLHIAQPPLSRQIKSLESELGVPLFERGTRPVRLTDAGQRLLDQTLLVLEGVDEIRSIARRMRRAERARLGIGLVPSVLYGKLPEVIRRFRGMCPNVDVVLLELTTLEQIGALRQGRIGVGFGRIPFEDPDVESILLKNEALLAALPSEHPKSRHKGAISLRQVAMNPLIIYPKAPRPSYADQVLSMLRERGLKPPEISEVKELQTALGLVAADSGVCIVPASVETLRRDNVVYRPIADKGVVSPIIMSYRKGDKSSELATMISVVKTVYFEDHTSGCEIP